MQVRELGKDQLAVATRIFETALGDDMGHEGRGAWVGYLEMSRTVGAFDADRLVGSAAQYPAELTMPGGGLLPVHAVTSVGVLPTHTRRGAARAMMADQFSAAATDGAAALVLEASEATIYGRFGYGPATTHANAIVGTEHWRLRRPLPDDGHFDFAEGEAIAHYAQPVYEAWRRTRPGQLSRPPQLWGITLFDVPAWRGGGGELQWVFHVAADGTPDGYVAYRTTFRFEGSAPASEAKVLEVVAADPAVRLLLLDFVARLDLVAWVNITGLAPDDGLAHLLVDPRRLRTPDVRDGLWARIIDVPTALSARRWWTDGTLVLEVLDDMVEAVAGRWRLEVAGGRASVARTDAPADLTLTAGELAMLWLGGHTPTALAHAGRLHATGDDALARATTMFAAIVAPQHVGEF